MLKIDNEFIKLNQNFVYSIVNKYANNHNREDLYQVGMMAMIKASEMYDSDKGVKFSTFSYKYILGDILSYIRENTSVKASRDSIRLYSKINKIKDYYKLDGKTISTNELSRMLNIDEKKIIEAENLNLNAESLDKSINEEENYTLKDVMSKKDIIDKNDLIELKYALKELKEEERKFLYERYYESKTQSEIAKEKNTNQVKIYRYEKKILNKLKDYM